MYINYFCSTHTLFNVFVSYHFGLSKLHSIPSLNPSLTKALVKIKHGDKGGRVWAVQYDNSGSWSMDATKGKINGATNTISHAINHAEVDWQTRSSKMIEDNSSQRNKPRLS